MRELFHALALFGRRSALALAPAVNRLPINAERLADFRIGHLEFALDLGVEWLALSFVQRPEDLDEARALTRGRAGIMTKLEKPSAVEALDAIVDKSDAD